MVYSMFNMYPLLLLAPKIHQLLPVLSRAVHKWFSLGLMLEVPADELKTLEGQYPHSFQTCLSNMLIWLFDNKEVTWSKVIDALFRVGLKEIARDLCQKHGKVYHMCMSYNVMYHIE